MLFIAFSKIDSIYIDWQYVDWLSNVLQHSAKLEHGFDFQPLDNDCKKQDKNINLPVSCEDQLTS